MNKTKIVLWAGIVLILLGAIIFAIAFAVSGCNVQFLSNVKTVTRRFDENADNPIQTLKIDFENAAIEIRPQDGIDALAIVYPQAQNTKGEDISEIEVVETDGTVSIVENYKWQAQLFTWNFESPTVVLHLPAHRTYTLDLSTKNGEIEFTESALNASKLLLHTNNGAITSSQTDISCVGDVKIETDNGAIKLGYIQANALQAETDNGAISLSGCSVAQKLFLETDNGTISLSGELKAHEFLVETDNGTIHGNECVIHAERISLSTNLGNVRVTVAGKQTDYTTTVKHNLGNANIQSQAGGEKQLYVSSDLGDIQIGFTE